MMRLSLLKKPPSLFREMMPEEGSLRVMCEEVETPSFLVAWYVALPAMLSVFEAEVAIM